MPRRMGAKWRWPKAEARPGGPPEIKLPQGLVNALGSIPDRMPFEDTIDRALDDAADKIASHPLMRKLEELHSRIPVVPSVEVGTPLGKIKTPELALPKPSPPEVDDRKKEAIKAAVADDLTGLIEKIPVVGAAAAPISDGLEDTFMAKIHDTLTPEEYELFKKKDKISPLTTLAMVDTLIRRKTLT